MPVDAFCFQNGEEIFCHRIVIGVSFAWHWRCYYNILQTAIYRKSSWTQNHRACMHHILLWKDLFVQLHFSLLGVTADIHFVFINLCRKKNDGYSIKNHEQSKQHHYFIRFCNNQKNTKYYCQNHKKHAAILLAISKRLYLVSIFVSSGFFITTHHLFVVLP